MTLDYLNATEEHNLDIAQSNEHGQFIVNFLMALVAAHIIRGVWVGERWVSGYGPNADADSEWVGTCIRIDSRLWR